MYQGHNYIIYWLTNHGKDNQMLLRSLLLIPQFFFGFANSIFPKLKASLTKTAVKFWQDVVKRSTSSWFCSFLLKLDFEVLDKYYNLY